MPSRARKAAAAGAIVAVTLAAGGAFAAFQTNHSYPDNAATGGELTVDTTGLPLTMDGKLFPTNCADDQARDADAVQTGQFSIENKNPVKAAYAISAAPKDGSSADQLDQFKNLWIRISHTTAGTSGKQEVPGASTPLDTKGTSPSTTTYYDGPLSALDAKKVDELGVIAKGGTQTYDVLLCLNDNGHVQNQGVSSPFDLTVLATTPSGANPTEETTTTTTAP